MKAGAATSGNARSSRARVVATVAGTLVVVVTEFVLLSLVYQRVQPTARAEVRVAAAAGELRSASTGQLPGLTRTVLAAAEQAGAAGASRSAVAAVRTAAAARTTSAVKLAALRRSAADLQSELAERHRQLDFEAHAAYVILLVVASLGWMVWFKRLVGRHRALQAAFTEQKSRAAGERRLAALISNSADVVAVCDADATISFITPSSGSVLGRPAEQLIGIKLTRLVHPSDLDLCLQLLTSLAPGGEQSFSLKMWHADGRALILEGTLANKLGDETIGGLVVTMRDVTERRELQDRLSFQALHDSLTGLPNRHLFNDRLAQALVRRGSGPALPLVVLLLDLDDFKAINDSAGHSIGDQVLAEVGSRLQGAIRAGDSVARLSADEFAVLMDAADIDMATELGEQLRRALLHPVVVGDQAINVQASIGLAQATPGELSAEEVLRNADVAMYLAKEAGKGGLAVYEPRRHSETLNRLELRADLQRALTRSELVLHYQPTIDLASGRVVGFEALVRWQHPTRGLLGPNLFIPIAEESGLVQPLGTWVLREACAAAAGMQRIGVRPTMSVNVSAQQLAQANFVELVLDVLASTGLPSDRLVLEITETVVLHDLDRIAPRLAALRERGVRVAIDDFGTGYSSLAYLSHLPVDVLKVDKSFIDRVTIDQQDASLAEAIISLSQSMNFTTVAEGVEERAQASWLLEARCDYGQGYLWSKPVDLATAQKILNEGTHNGPIVAPPTPQGPPPPVFAAPTGPTAGSDDAATAGAAGAA